MILNIKYILIIVTLSITACTQNTAEHEVHAHQDEHGHEEEGEREGAHLSPLQFEALGMKTGPMPIRNIAAVVEANGRLEVPPQNEATVTAMLGANVVSIEIIEGDDVRSGQILAYVAHPEITRLQSDYRDANHRLQFLEQENARQKRLYEEEIGSGRDYQQTRSDLLSAETKVQSLAMQLQQIGLVPEKVLEGNLYDKAPIKSPISGTVTMVEVKIGQYVQPEKDMFEIVNVDHIHADLMVFENDIAKVEKGQRVRFRVETLGEQELWAEIYSVGKKFEQAPKAVHVHAEIENKSGRLIPGMYIRGEIIVDDMDTFALPESALIREGDHDVAFLAAKHLEDGHEEWAFTPFPVVSGTVRNGWVAVQALQEFPQDAVFALNNAYYLLAEMKKGEAEHSH